LAKRKPDVDEVASLATGGGGQSSGAAVQLRALAQTVIPSQGAIDETVVALRQAVQSVADRSDRSVELAERRTALLARALELHSRHGDMACPVCGQGDLDAGWHDRVAAELARDNTVLTDLRAARTKLGQVRHTAHALINQVPSFTAPAGVTLTALPRADTARQRWLQAPEDDAALAEHLAQCYLELAAAVTELSAEAAALAADREDTWAPLARQLASWVDLKKQATAEADTVRTLKEAAGWIKANAATLRNQRLEPLAARSREIWAMLRQESNVDLGAITLEGQGNRRHVELRAEVDGELTGALGVMSQGELHALALALFLPRATAQASPFRFVVLDDPIQAMDPAKIDGFARVLVDVARDRQVVVFSHDDRLAEMVRRMAIPGARILEITRGPGSIVRVGTCLDPARRYVADAYALAADSGVPAGVQARVLPGICRLAVEAAARDVFYARRFATGASHLAAEKVWQDAVRTRQRVALALHDDAEQEIARWSEHGRWRRTVLEICGRGAHDGLRSDPRGAVDDLRKTVNDILRCRS
jgi:hypothetical protein